MGLEGQDGLAAQRGYARRPHAWCILLHKNVDEDIGGAPKHTVQEAERVVLRPATTKTSIVLYVSWVVPSSSPNCTAMGRPHIEPGFARGVYPHRILKKYGDGWFATTTELPHAYTVLDSTVADHYFASGQRQQQWQDVNA